MSKRNLLIILVVAVAFLITTGIPTKSNPGPDDLFAGRNVNMTSSKIWPDPEGDVYLQRQNEPSLAVSTLNPLHLLAGANDYRSVDTWDTVGRLPGIPEEATAGDAWLGVFTSYDGGQSWKSKLLPGYLPGSGEAGDSLIGFDAASDPTVRAGVNGLFFYSGIAFDRIRNGPSVIFVCRYKDYNDTEGHYIPEDNNAAETEGPEQAIRYIDTTIIDEGTSGQFGDKPWMAVDIPRPGRGYPDSIVYLVYSTFLGDITKTVHNKIMFTRSINGGETWEAPIKLSESHRINQGTTVAIDPQNGQVYIAWRRWAAGNDPDAIMVAKSNDHGLTFTKAVEAAIIEHPFDQPTVDLELETAQFRTNAFPTMTVDNNHTVYIAWTQREYEDGPARIVFKLSIGGSDWSLLPIKVEDYFDLEDSQAGHQFMPSMTFAAGKLLIAWYDSRYSVRLKKGGNTEKWISDYYLGEDVCPEPAPNVDHPCHWRETIDVRIAQANPGALSFEPSMQVSRYIWFFEIDEISGDPIIENDYLKPIQVQFNAPNYPLFQGGTAPFIGDYIDLVPAPMFINDGGNWRFNTGQPPSDPNLPPDPFVFYVSWTDNRDVRPPAEDFIPGLINPWTLYWPPKHEFCTSGINPGMRNQNIYVSRITSGISVGCPGNYKLSGLEQKAFVVNVENMTGSLKSFNLNILNPPAPDPPAQGSASFSPSEDLPTLTIGVDKYSSISRHVFVQSNIPHTTIVEISEAEGGGDFIGYVNLYLVAEGGSEEESIALDIIDGGIVNWSDPPGGLPMPNADIFNATMFNATMFNATMFNATMFNATMFNATMFNATMFNATMFNATMFNATMFNGNIANPLMSNSSFEESINGAEVVDKFWQVTNTSDTASSYTLKTIAGDDLPDTYYSQLLVYKVHRTPATDGTCTLLFDNNHELLLNIENPNVTPDISTYAKIVDPDLANVDFTNATFSLAPGEVAIVILRVIDTTGLFLAPSPGGFGGLSGTSNGTQTESDLGEIADNVGAVVISHSSTEGAEITGITLMVLPDSLPAGTTGIEYSYPLRAIGGTGTYSWSFHEGLLPPGVDVYPDGTISGCPVEAGEYNFTVQVTDVVEDKTDTQKFTLTIVDPPPITIGLDQSVVPFGMKGSDYSGNLSFTASGGVPPYTEWILSAVNNWTGYTVNLGLGLTSSGPNGETAMLTGAPLLAGEFTVNVVVFDNSCPSPISYTLSFQLCVSPIPLSIAITPPLKTTDPPALVDGALGNEYNVEFLVSNWESTPVWNVTEPLPLGLKPVISDSFPQKMSITGIPVYDETKNYPASYTITVSVTDNFPNCDTSVLRDITRNITITINPKQPKWAIEGVAGEAIAVATDTSGNVYVTGFTSSEATGKDYYTVKYDVDGNFAWEKTYDGPGHKEDIPSAIAVFEDSLGNISVYVTGTSNGGATTSGPDIYTVAYDDGGNFLWEDRYDGPSHLGDGANDLTIDKEGNVYVAGYVHRGKQRKHADYCTIKYSPSLKMLWDERYDSTRNGDDKATAIAVDESTGDVYVTGKSKESLPKRGQTTHDYLTIKYNKRGRWQWEIRDDGLGNANDEPTDMVLHEVANEVFIYITGYTSYETGTPGITLKDYFTVKYDADKNNLWPGGMTYGSAGGDDVATAIAVGPDPLTGDIYVYVTGKSSGANGFDYATVKYSSTGTQLWEKRHDGGIGNDEAVSIAVEGTDIYVAGFVTKQEEGEDANADFFVIKYDTSGDIIWIASYDGSSGKDDVARDMAVNGTGIFVVGYSEKVSIGTVFAVVKYDK